MASNSNGRKQEANGRGNARTSGRRRGTCSGADPAEGSAEAGKRAREEAAQQVKGGRTTWGAHSGAAAKAAEGRSPTPPYSAPLGPRGGERICARRRNRTKIGVGNMTAANRTLVYQQHGITRKCTQNVPASPESSEHKSRNKTR